MGLADPACHPNASAMNGHAEILIAVDSLCTFAFLSPVHRVHPRLEIIQNVSSYGQSTTKQSKKKRKEKEKPWGICGPPTGGGMSEEHNESRYRYKVLGIHGDTRPRQSLLFSLLGTGRSTLAIHAVKLERLR